MEDRSLWTWAPAHVHILQKALFHALIRVQVDAEPGVALNKGHSLKS